MPPYTKADQLRSNRKSPKRAARGKFSAETIRAIYERDNGACVKCGTESDLEAVPHHIRFKSQGGLGTIDNGVTICRTDHLWAHSCREGRVWFEQYREEHLL
jgi:5-methylcytosine-specific restriction endonuclease McrA